MFFGFDEQQLAVRDAVGSLLDKQCDVGALQRCWAGGGAGSLRGLWSELAVMGVQGALAPESAGGGGFDLVTMALILAEAGRVAVPLPVAETAAVGVPLVVAAEDPTGVLAGLVEGSLVMTVASGGLAPAASISDLFLLDGAVLYRRDEVDIEPVKSVDLTRDLARVTPRAEGVRLASGGADLAALAAAAELIGLGREMIRMTVEYVKEREQFGVPIGSFQAVKHHLADATMHVEFAAPAVWAAAHQVDVGSPDRVRAVSLAKAAASEAAVLAGRKALQCHGAMGYSYEYPLHMWMKRAWCLAAAHGTAAEHRDRIGRELGV